MELLHQLAKLQRPTYLQLLVQQGLGTPEVVDGHERIILLQVTDPLDVELPRQPVAAVETDLDLQREPGLQPHVHRAEYRMHEIEVIVKALARCHCEFQMLCGAIADEVVRATRLNTAEDGK